MSKGVLTGLDFDISVVLPLDCRACAEDLVLSQRGANLPAPNPALRCFHDPLRVIQWRLTNIVAYSTMR